MKIMSGNANLPLARAIAGYLELPLTGACVQCCNHPPLG